MSMQPLVKVGLIAGVIAAVANTVVVAIVSAADVSLEVDGKAIPIVAFALWSLVGAGIGIVLARFLRNRQRFVIVTTVATALTLIPAVASPDDTATKLVLVATHVIAAAIIIPALALARQLVGPEA